VKPDPNHDRPAEVHLLRGAAGKTRRVLGWTHRIGFEDLVREMVGCWPKRD
jgi:GDPmannose 4,6-dehydratase